MDRVPVVQVLCELREVPKALERVQSLSGPCILPTNQAGDDDNSRNNSPTLKLGCWDRSVSFSLPGSAPAHPPARVSPSGSSPSLDGVAKAAPR